MNEEQDKNIGAVAGNEQTNPENQKQPSGENLPSDEKKSFGKKTIMLLVALLVVVVLVSAAFYFLQKKKGNVVAGQPEVEGAGMDKTSSQEQENEQTDFQDGNYIYENQEYGFALTFPATWKGYMVVSEETHLKEMVASFSFYIQTSDEKYRTKYKGYASPVSVSVFDLQGITDPLFDDLKDPKSGPILQGDKHLFKLSYWQDSPSDLVGIDLGFESIKNSLRLLSKDGEENSSVYEPPVIEEEKLNSQKEIARSAVPGVTICLDQGGFVEEPSSGKLICRGDESLGFWSDPGELEELGGSWGGCEMKITREPVEFEYCITLSSGQIYGCTEGGCSLRDATKEESKSSEQGNEAVSQAEDLLETQKRASEICWDKIEQLGDSRKAREEAVKEIKKLPGAKDAGISEDGSVWIEHVSGIEGIISLNPPGTL